MTTVLEIPSALARLLLSEGRLMTTNIAVLVRVFRNLGRANLHILSLPLLILCLALMPVRIMYWITALPYNLITLASNLRTERIKRKISAQGSNIYPLW